jgi:hypothetical protein
MTPQQTTISKTSVLDTTLYAALSMWFIKKCGHTVFEKVPIPEQYPHPVIIMD